MKIIKHTMIFLMILILDGCEITVNDKNISQTQDQNWDQERDVILTSVKIFQFLRNPYCISGQYMLCRKENLTVCEYKNPERQDQILMQQEDVESQEMQDINITVPNVETELKCESEVEMPTSLYEPVKVGAIDYDSFESRMTNEEWEGFQQYFPILKENEPFYIADFGDDTNLNKEKEPVKEGEYALFCRYASEDVTDIKHYVEDGWEDFGERLIEKVQVFDLDGDGVQELILETKPGNYFLILHCDKNKFYGWEIMYRGFECIQTNGVYICSGGADSNRWKCIRFDNGGWLEETLCEQNGGKYYLHGEEVDENTFFQQIDTYETEVVTAYQPKPREY